MAAGGLPGSPRGCLPPSGAPPHAGRVQVLQGLPVAPGLVPARVLEGVPAGVFVEPDMVPFHEEVGLFWEELTRTDPQLFELGALSA